MATAEQQDAVAYFLEDLTYHGKSERTLDAYERVLRRFERFLDEERGVQGPRSAVRRDCLAFVHELRGDASRSTIATYASYLHRFYAYMTQVGEFEGNPMALVMEELDESIDKDPARRDIPIDRMRAFVGEITHPLERAVVVTLLKTGMRIGELCNLDLRDVNLGDSAVLAEYDVEPRVQIEDRPYTLYVAADVARGAVVNGEERTASNKRKRDTLVPIDAELARVLEHALAIRPDAVSEAEPLFLSTKDQWGHRLKPEWARSIVTNHAREAGWYRDGGGAAENVTPHYFRHFFTTHLRDRTGDRGIVKYLRGDVAEDVIDTYTHNWGDRVREVYEANIYRMT
ncbi:MAG: tyrosine-type recombinase/integrase [Halobacteriales archaeon]|nr:tyrosine-type recombinase/integrase [Halobacteriales archaeon]